MRSTSTPDTTTCSRSPASPRPSWRHRLRHGALAAALLLGSAALTPPIAAAQSSTPAQPSSATEQDVGAGAGINAILSAPEAYIGRTTTVSARVDEIVGTRSYAMIDPESPGERLLVVGALHPQALFTGVDVPTPGDEQIVEVTGEVMHFDLAAIEERIGINLNDLELEGWAGQPVMIATTAMPAVQ